MLIKTVFLLLSVITAAKQRCGKNVFLIGKTSGNRLDLKKAKNYCEGRGGHLIQINILKTVRANKNKFACIKNMKCLSLKK
jgi:hypothetical protein